MMALAVGVVCLFKTKATALRPLDPPTVTLHRSYYAIAGSTLEQLQAQMGQPEPSSRKDSQYAAKTDWEVNWSYNYTAADNRCLISSAKVNVDVVVTLPKWNDTPRQPKTIVAEWNRYLTALQIHEDGHTANGIAAGGAVLQVLEGLPPSSSCHALKATADKTIKAVADHYRQRDRRYDQITQHGLTQGAVLQAIAN
jgi:predicted secreted Zn-dependent protease